MASCNVFSFFVLFCNERDFILSLSDNNQAADFQNFNFTSRYLDDLLIIQ